MAKESSLTLRCAGLPPLYLRNCTQELHPLLSGDMRRTVNGTLVYAGSTLHHKYRSVLHVRDKTSFSSQMLWRGNVVEVECIQRLKETIKGTSALLSRSPLPASVNVKAQNGYTVAVRSITERTLHLEQPLQEGVVSYRPLLTMHVINFQLQADNEDAITTWQVWLEEV